MAVVSSADPSARATLTPHALRRHAKRLRREMAAVGVTLTTAASQETLARVFGFKNWHEAERVCQAAQPAPPTRWATAPTSEAEHELWRPSQPSGETLWARNPDVDPGADLLEWLLRSAAEGWTEWSFSSEQTIVGHCAPNAQGKTHVALSTTPLNRDQIEALLFVLHEGKSLPDLQDMSQKSHPTQLTFSSKHHRVRQKPVQLQVWACPVMHAHVPGWTLMVRAIPQVPPQAESLGIPQILLDKARTEQNAGMWFFAGATGSGRSTTLASLLRERLRAPLLNPRAKLLVDETPASYDWHALAPDHASVITLSETKVPDRNWSPLVSRLNQDLVVIGETGNAHALEAGMRVALCGTEIWTQVHGVGVARTIHQMIHTLPEDRREWYARHLLDNLTVAVAQRLMPHRDGRIAVWEWLDVDFAVRRTLKQTPLDQWGVTIQRLMAERGTRFVDQAAQSREKVTVTAAQSPHWERGLGHGLEEDVPKPLS